MLKSVKAVLYSPYLNFRGFFLALREISAQWEITMIDILMEQRKCKLYQFLSQTYLLSSTTGLQVQG